LQRILTRTGNFIFQEFVDRIFINKFGWLNIFQWNCKNIAFLLKFRTFWNTSGNQDFGRGLKIQPGKAGIED